jgi:ribosomal protein L37AE/L43A
MMLEKKHRCYVCGKLTANFQRINGGPWHCYDGCYSTTGYDWRKVKL